jgi:hypothetical protein
MAKNTVKVSTGQGLIWPKVCVLCLNDAAEDLPSVFDGWGQVIPVPYCAQCHDRVKRFDNWKDSLFMLSVIFGAIGGLLALIGIVVNEGWTELLRVGNTVMAFSGGFLVFFAIFYALLWLLLLPMRLIFRSKLAAPGVKKLKSKDPLVAPLKFTNAEYARRFQEANALA